MNRSRPNRKAPDIDSLASHYLARGLKQFLGSGPAPNTVNVPVLARLLRGMH